MLGPLSSFQEETRSGQPCLRAALNTQKLTTHMGGERSFPRLMTWQYGKHGECFKRFGTLFSVNSAPTVHRGQEQYFQKTAKKNLVLFNHQQAE